MAKMDYSSRSVFWYLLNFTLVLVAVFGLIGIGTLVRYSNAIAPSRTITISGEGKVEIVPDVATISASVVNRGVDATKVQQENTQKMNAVVAFVKSQGVKDADIKTTGYNLYPTNRWDPKTGASVPTGYEATQTITVKLRDIGTAREKAGVVAGGLVPAGANQVYGITYDVENPEAQRAQARAKAFDDARSKASLMAEQNGVRIARVITFSESTGYGMPIYYDRALSASSKGAEAAVAPSIEPGSQQVQVNVNVTYEIR